MRKATLYFIAAELLDVITTVLFISMGLWENNPLVERIGWINSILFKVFGTLLVVVFLEKKKERSIDWIFACIVFIPVLLNAVGMLLEMNGGIDMDWEWLFCIIPVLLAAFVWVAFFWNIDHEKRKSDKAFKDAIKRMRGEQ
jgi:surface polysaccharide O-acyltransferase-like enzyme